MKKLLLSLICIGCFGFVFAQGSKGLTVQGTVVDSAARQPLEFATITLFPKGSKKPATGSITDATGKFAINDAGEGVFTILIESIGYKSFSVNDITISKTDKQKELGIIKLVTANKTMEAVVVTAQTKTIDNKIDRLVFNAEKDISSQTGTASDVLKKVPQVAVDADGNVQLAGSGGVRFLINGKPSTAFGSSVADVLQSIPASQIKSIEVITNPGAKYDAQGLGGIINIILKTNKAKGYNGNLSLTAGTRQDGGSFNFNVRNNNFGANAFVSGSKRLKATVPFYSERNTANGAAVDYLRQDGSSKFERHGFQTGVGFDWTIKKLNSISGSVSYNDFGNKGVGNTLQDLEISKGGTIPPVFTQINSSNISKFTNTDLGLNYKRTFAKENRELELAVNSSIGNGSTITANEQFALPAGSINSATQSTNPGKSTETQISADYTEPLAKDVVLGTGSKFSFDNINSNSSATKFDQGMQSYIPDNSLTSNLHYNQKVYAAYAELSFPLFNGITAKAGSRYERTEINAFYSNAQQQKKVPGYNTFVPSVYLSKKIDDKQSVKLSYSKRIERPEYSDLNPFVNTTDPKNLSTGNPNLLPEIGHRIEMSYTRDFGKTGSAMVNLFYRINENDIQPYATYYPTYNVGDSVYTNVSVSMRQNIGAEKNLGANFFGDLHINSKFGLRGNLFMFRRHTINNIDKGFNTNSFNYRFNLNATYQFAPTLVAEMFGNFNSARHEAQGIYPSFISYTVAVRKQFWNKNGSLALTANNFAGKYVDQKTKLFGPGYDAVSLRQIPFRSVGLNFTWKFGKLEFKKDKAGDMNMQGGE
jgi:ferric enterobactin receptor